MRLAYQQDLSALEEQLDGECDLVRAMLVDTMVALQECDLALADAVIAADDAVDARYFEIRIALETLIARQHPVAADLRLVLAMLDVNMHLERMADLCVTIAKLTRLTCELASDAQLIEGFVDMSRQASHMISVAMRCFADRDVAAAESLVELDEVIDHANRRVVDRVLDLGTDPALREWGLRMIIVSRCLERIGDHAVDIGEQAAFLVTGEFREFTDASHQ